VTPDNNQAERDIRMAKLVDTTADGFCTMAGADQLCILRSGLATGRKHGETALTLLHDVFSALHPGTLSPAR